MNSNHTNTERSVTAKEKRSVKLRNIEFQQQFLRSAVEAHDIGISLRSRPLSPHVQGLQLIHAREKKGGSHECKSHRVKKSQEISTSSTVQIESLRNALNQGEYVCMGELFPNDVDRNSRPISYHEKDDSKLTLQCIEKELASLSSKTTTKGLFLTEDLSHLIKKRQKYLEYYCDIIREAVHSWTEYESTRRLYLENRNEESSEDPMELQRFDDEYRRFMVGVY